MSIGLQIVGKSKQIEQLKKLVAKLAASKKNVVITGESGTGKTTVASLIGEPRGCTTFSLSHQQNEGELKASLASIATDVVLFENMEEAGFRNQAVVCSFLDECSGKFQIIVTLSATPDALLQQQKIDENVLRHLRRFESIPLRPLREHPEDIPLLVRHFGGGLTIDINTIDALVNHPWPGNIAQLRSIVERCASSSENKFELPLEFVDERSELAKTIGSLMGRDRVVLDKSLDAMEGTLIRRALERFGFNESLAAEFLGMSDQVFAQKLRRIVITHQQ